MCVCVDYVCMLALFVGCLLGLGLLGHLSVLTVTDTCDYLIQGHEPTTIAILLGCATSKLGTADAVLSKTISLHLPTLLPANHNDIEISPLVQAAALVSLGLLHCGSGHRLITEFLLVELSRRPSSDKCDSREAMLTSAAWALGMVLLGKGTKRARDASEHNPAPAAAATTHAGVDTAQPDDGEAYGLADLNIEDRLLLHIEGGKRPPESTMFPSNYDSLDTTSKSSRVLEGPDINTEVTAPGATIALALMYIRTNDADILQRLRPPRTTIALDVLRPDLLIYRAVACCLVMWEAVEPTEQWVYAQIPEAILFGVHGENWPAAVAQSRTARPEATTHRTGRQALDHRTAFALYICSLSGYVYGMGIVFAGTSDARARITIIAFLRLLQR